VLERVRGPRVLDVTAVSLGERGELRTQMRVTSCARERDPLAAAVARERVHGEVDDVKDAPFCLRCHTAGQSMKSAVDRPAPCADSRFETVCSNRVTTTNLSGAAALCMPARRPR